MEITNLSQFIHYFSRIKSRTQRVIDVIPENMFSWKPSEEAFSFAELIIHISNINYQMYGDTILGNKSTYSGHSIDDMTADSVKSYYQKSYDQLSKIIEGFAQEDLERKVETPAGTKITCWKWLRAMIEHEIHHRGQIYLYLKLLNIQTPPLYGLTSEEVARISKN